MSRLFLNELGIVTPLGTGCAEVSENLMAGSQAGIRLKAGYLPDQDVHVGVVDADLPELGPEWAPDDSRNNALFLRALQQIEPAILQAKEQYGADRIAVIVGTSTSGLSDSEPAIRQKMTGDEFPPDFDYARQDPGSISTFVARYYGLTGLNIAVSTACTSSVKALATARRLIRAGICDAAIVGGADTLCRFTLNGFHSLDSVSSNICNPFSRNRDGITIGEGAAAFLVTPEPGPVEVLGIGESSDAHHISAPDPEAAGAIAAMQGAIDDAGIAPGQVGYVNLHGTATPLNDAMEALAVTTVFGDQTCCSSTKGMTGHMLGAAGGCELGFLWLMLHPDFADGALPPHIWDGELDRDIPGLKLVTQGQKLPDKAPLALSNSFAFGGNNVSVLVGRAGQA